MTLTDEEIALFESYMDTYSYEIVNRYRRNQITQDDAFVYLRKLGEWKTELDRKREALQ